MLRSFLIYLSKSQTAYNMVMKLAVAQHASRRFVAGETVEDVVKVAKRLEARGFRTSLNRLGEHVDTAGQADEATTAYVQLLDTIAESGIRSNVSVKPSNLGLVISEKLCTENMIRILEKAKATENFIRFEMEDSPYTDKTLSVFRKVRDQYCNIGVVQQAYLYRTQADLRDLLARDASIRLCKGAYLEPESIAFQRKADVDANYKKLAEMLILDDGPHGFATHDPKMMDHIKQFTTRQAVDTKRNEFQMLYGVRRDLQEQLLRDNWNVRIYLPYGTHWYPYLMRRMAERPANMFFILGNLIKESGARI
ncbi:MAG: proline dehydrogenase family protein [Chloroflexi bacterium]|nr:proline dehydrogenase family protein [Chloroflexota bacterium]